MAHKCDECGDTCYCGGDIDDIVFEDSDFTSRCNHCEGKFLERAERERDVDDF